MPERRETRLLKDASPCDTNFYEGGPSTVSEAKKIGRSFCPHKEKCDVGLNPSTGFQCVMRAGVDVAKYVAEQGNTVKEEVNGDFRKFFMQSFPPKGFVWSPDRKKFVFLKDKDEVLGKIQEFATLALFGTRTTKDTKVEVTSRRKAGTLTQHPVSLDGISIDAGETAMRASERVERDGGVPVHACGARSYGDCPCWTCTTSSCAACFASMI